MLKDNELRTIFSFGHNDLEWSKYAGVHCTQKVLIQNGNDTRFRILKGYRIYKCIYALIGRLYNNIQETTFSTYAQ